MITPEMPGVSPICSVSNASAAALPNRRVHDDQVSFLAGFNAPGRELVEGRGVAGCHGDGLRGRDIAHGADPGDGAQQAQGNHAGAGGHVGADDDPVERVVLTSEIEDARDDGGVAALNDFEGGVGFSDDALDIGEGRRGWPRR